ncbi:MAG: AAA family ATPase [Acidimicrobiales bacterium]
MFLRALTIKGFKSFADSTTLAMEPGVTVVVGPNGSGKSNVVDAIGWVLGAQAPSAVRCSRMDDVIFAGTAKRAALGRAEVSLTIDNGAGLLPVDFAEVTVTRTLFRSGDSEYAINGVPCRLLDVQEMLSDSGVGRQQHVIISQGQIDAVLNARPEDRRLIIEEAAGVLKFRRRKEKAERRLASTEANLIRLQDLLREVRRQLRPLERQADDARRHGSVVAELTALRIFLAGQELTRLRMRLQAGAGARQELAGLDRSTRDALAELDTAVLHTEAQLSAMGGDDLGDALVRFESLREKGRGLAILLAERRRGIERDREASIDRGVIATLEAEASRLAGELEGVEAEAGRVEPEMARLADQERDLAEVRARFQSDWDGFDAAAAPGARPRRG